MLSQKINIPSNFSWLSFEILDALESLPLFVDTPPVKEIEKLLSSTLLLEGKRLRPLLCFLVGNFWNIPLKDLVPYARAAELVHAATLSHDDVIDESVQRRNKPTLRMISSNTKSVLIGDFLLSRVMSELGVLGNIRMIQTLAHAVEELVLGEWMQYEKRKKLDVSWEHLEQVAEKKTGALIAWCCLVPNFLVPVPVKFTEYFYNFGQSLGIAFQMVDDILDFSQNAEKPFAQDLKEGLINFVSFSLLNCFPELHSGFQKIMDTQHMDCPIWTADQLEKAIHIVYLKAEEKIKEALDILEKMTQLAYDSQQNFSINAMHSLKIVLQCIISRSH